ncbi:AMP-binding protein [Sphingobium subterraneum]|uniref:acetate--CoA ligase n=1 Tax=Sphingobium subterraneum TaxID=627688 RepID=A0A841IVP1_9SPHN|nr:AMP-binding protein [Sphingobium subterraneum]MBB6122979.1 acetyl-CoA synthetase [Sphingobium subterraneum]
MTASEKTDLWTPTADDVAHAHVTALARTLQLPDYDALLQYSVENPAGYWQKTLAFLDLEWSKKPDSYGEFARGREFPSWFPGGELNWVDSIVKFGDDPASSDRTAIIAEREDGTVTKISFAELSRQVRCFAAGLAEQGVKRGDRIGLFTENGIEATVTLLAIAYLGAIVVPLFSGFGTDAIVSRLGSCGARGLVGSTGFDRRGQRVNAMAAITDALRQLPLIDLLILKGGAGEAIPKPGIAWQAVLDNDAPALPSARMTPDDPFMVIYTSGTTGKPKGAVHTHGGFPLKIAHDAAVHFDVGAGDVFCWPADMGWIAGTLVLSVALLRGATLVCYDGAPDFPDWSRLSRIVERHKITHLGSAPTLIRGLAANMPLSVSGDTSTIELLITAGEGIDPDHFLWFHRHFGHGRAPVINYTGGTEVSGALLSSVVVRPIPPASFNTTSPGVEVDVVDANGQPVLDQIGELAIRAPFVGMTHSFWQDDERYLDSYWRTIPGLWIHGDLAMRTSRGEFFMLGRSDDTIKVAGKRLGPAEVEEVILELPSVSEAAAIGVEDAVKGQKLVVFVITASAYDGDAAALATAIRKQVDDNLGKPFRPSAVHVVRQLPKTRSSKVMRRLIRSIYCDQPLGDLSALDNPSALDEIRRMIPA